MQREARCSIVFRHWLRAHPQYTCAYELKQTCTQSILFSALKDHQIAYLQAIESDKGTLIRVQALDGGEPDYLYLRSQPAYVIIFYPAFFCIIRIGEFMTEKENRGRPSLTGERAQEIAEITVHTKKPR